MFLMAVALAVSPPADQWVEVGRTDAFREYLDREDVTRIGAKVTFWTRRDFLPNRGVAWSEIEFDCSSRMGTILAYIRDDAGVISHNIKRPHRGAAPISPGSTEEIIFNIVCR